MIFRDTFGKDHIYEPIAAIEFQGSITYSGESRGHYVCDVKSQENGVWYRTNDNDEPQRISHTEVSKLSYVVLFTRK